VHVHASLIDASVLVAVGCLLAQARLLLARIFAHIHWSIIPAISVVACAIWVADICLWQSVDELKWRHYVLGSTVCVMGLAYLGLRRNPGSLAPIRLASTTIAHGVLLADCLIAFMLTMAVAYFLLVVEVCLTNGELTQAIMTTIADSPELAGYLLGQ
jgi:hypothetical protein